MKLLFVLTLCVIVVLTSADNVTPKKIELPVLVQQEKLSDADIANLAPKLDSTPTGKKQVVASAGKTTSINPLIIGGTQSARGDFPWQVALVINRSWFCGGSLIDGWWVMTAAHCAKGGRSFDITLGATDRSTVEPEVIKMTSTTAIVHPLYKANLIINDIALVKLTRDVTSNFGALINIIRLPRTSDATLTFEGQRATVSGWGLTSDGGSVSLKLNSVVLSVISNALCAETFGKRSIVSSSICCSTDGGLHNSCNGDSGGPLIYKETDGFWSQIGIVSFGSSQGCTAPYPDAYTRVTSYLGWISQSTNIKIRA